MTNDDQTNMQTMATVTARQTDPTPPVLHRSTAGDLEHQADDLDTIGDQVAKEVVRLTRSPEQQAAADALAAATATNDLAAGRKKLANIAPPRIPEAVQIGHNTTPAPAPAPDDGWCFFSLALTATEVAVICQQVLGDAAIASATPHQIGQVVCDFVAAQIPQAPQTGNWRNHITSTIIGQQLQGPAQ